jgi:hypothetical protein
MRRKFTEILFFSKITIIHKPEHGPVQISVCDSVFEFEHCDPPYAGEGFVQSLVLIFVPDPQLLEQEPQSPQFDHAPFTVIYNDNVVFN